MSVYVSKSEFKDAIQYVCQLSWTSEYTVACVSIYEHAACKLGDPAPEHPRRDGALLLAAAPSRGIPRNCI